MNLWRWLLNPCLLSHSTWHMSREAGQLIKRCDRCQQPMGAILAGEMIKTKLPQNVGGAVTTKALRERNNITEFPRVSER